MLHDDMQGHDALLDGLDFDPVKGVVSLRLQAYPKPDASTRTAIVVLFEGVTAVAMHADVASLAGNRFAGNVSYWHMADSRGTSYIYLAEGYIAITAEGVPKVVQS